jgi:hypothetical protein
MSTPSNAELYLRDVADWTPEMQCTETAICGATGLPASVVIKALNRAVADKAAQPDPNGAYAPEHWTSALKSLGFSCEIRSADHPISLRDFVSQNELPFVLLLQTEQQVRGQRIGHLVAVQDKGFLDCNTGGKVVSPNEIPVMVATFLVKHVIDLE